MHIFYRLKGICLLLGFVATATGVSAQCTADFDLPADTICSQTSVSFTDKSTGTGTITHLWDFGDASSPSNFSNAQNPSHIFIDTGLLSVKLTITDANSCTRNITKNVYVLRSPIAAFTRYNNCVGNNLVLGNTTSFIAKDTISEWKWYFGTSDSSSQKTPTHSFGSTGTYQAQLIAISGKGCRDTSTQNVKIYSQPTISVSDTEFCAQTAVDFDVQITETSDVTYSWRLGDGNSSINKSLVHIYNAGGVYKPRIKIIHSLTDSCFSTFDSITVFSLPKVNFSINNDSQCFAGNDVCITDLTSIDANGGAITKRTLVFGDGFIDNTTPPSTKVICHKYADPNGGSYPLTLEATDANGCFASLQVPDAITIYPDFTPSFTFSQAKDCFKTVVTLTNTSSFDSTKLDSFEWDFGNGVTRKTGFASTVEEYTTSGNYFIKLTVTDTSGCTKSVTSAEDVESVVVNFNPTIDKDTSCFYSNIFNLSNPVNLNATGTWIFGDGNQDTGWTRSYGYNNPGRFVVQLRITADNCDTTQVVDTVTVLGPRANIGEPLNRYQCEIHDTVYFTNTTTLPYLSDHGPAPGNVKRIWNFADLSAPQCTTDTKNGINVGLNCNFSKDSLVVKHWYTPGDEGCYRVQLLLEDTVWGCLDTNSVSLALREPVASPDLLATPPVSGLSFPKPDCLGPEGTKSKSVLLMQHTQPSCDRETYWLMWDSLYWAQRGTLDSGWEFQSANKNYSYDSLPGDTGGKVTIGIIIGNGRDASNNQCFDTAWYHHIFDFDDLFPFITSDYDPSVSRCPGTTVNFRVTDTLQNGITNYNWNFGDGSTDISGVNAYKTQHTFDSMGSFVVTLTMQNSAGCSGSATDTIYIGFESEINVSASQICAGDTIFFTSEVSNFGIGAPWTNSGSETIDWDFGDGNGFATSGVNPAKPFTKVGDYSLRIALEDSFGCIDTVTVDSAFKVFGMYARLLHDDTLVCPQVFQLVDSSRLFNPANFLNIPAGDSISSWEWDVNPGNLKSFLEAPYFNFPAGGNYTFKLKVQNSIGCIDSATEDFFVKGPIPSFIIVSDTTGCSPLVVEFDNQSINATSYTWNFRDAENNTITTFSDTNVTNTYIGGGLYKPFLTAESSEFDSKQGRLVTCRANYPDTSNQQLRLVAVNATPTPNFSAVNSCSNFSVDFTDSSEIDSGSITKYLWKFGDGDTSSQQNPSHTYADTGTYTVTFLVYGSAGCVDSTQENVSIAPTPKANFTVAETCLSDTAQFTDSSTTANAFIVRWEWDFGDLSTSVFQNPKKKFSSVGTYPVELKILTNNGCEDSITKNIDINPEPVASFTNSDVCQNAVLPLSNTSTISSGSMTYLWEFGDGSTSTDVNPVKTFPSTGDYLIRLNATSDKGCKHSSQTFFDVHPTPQANFLVNNNSQCLNQNFFANTNLSTIASGTFTSSWNYGDGSPSTTDTFHVYTDSGTYTIRLVEQSNLGCLDTSTYVIKVYPVPAANFSINDTAQCLNTNNFVFTNTSIDTGSLTYLWDMGDGSTQTTENPTKTYLSDISYTVRLIVINITNCRDTIEKNVNVLPLPQPSFTIDDTGQCVNNNLFGFTNNTTIKYGSFTSQWLFGDGNSSSANAPSHTYAADSNYTVSLIGTSNRGCRDTATNTLTVFPKPVPAFSINDTNQCVNTNNYIFTNLSTIKYGTNTYTWYFTTTDSATTTHANFVYPAADVRLVTLKAVSDQGCIDSIRTQVTIYPKPQSSFVINDTNQCLNTNSFSFSGQSTISNGSLIYNWDFGNGVISTQKDTTIVYANDGAFNVTLINRSNFDCYDTVSTLINVYPTPEPKFSINDSDQCQQENLFTFTNNSTINSGTMSYEWRFGNEGTTTSVSPDFSFTNDITHIVKLIAESNFGCIDSTDKEVIVFPSPQMAFTINDTGQCLRGNQFDYTNQSTINTGTQTYTWDLGDGFTSTATDTTVEYTNYGIYTVRLIATSDKNCPDTLEKEIQVFAMPIAQFSINDTDQCLKANSFVINNQSSIPQGTQVYHWQWGNGDTANTESPTYSYSQDSTLYTIKLITSSNFDCKDSIEKQVIVHPQANVDFSINDSTQCVNGNSFVYSNNSIVKSGSLTYAWDLGDGFTSTTTDTTIVYNNFGVYAPTLITTTNFGCKDTLEKYSRVYAKPTPLFAVNDSDQCLEGNLYDINNLSTIAEGTNTYIWYWGNGDTASAEQPDYSYPADTIYTIKLLVTSNFDCKDSIEKQIVVYPQPVVAFTINDSGQCVNNNLFDFTNASTITYGSLTYFWDFDDGRTSTQKDTAITYSNDITYRPVLRATTNFGCTDTFGKYVVVHSKPNPNFTVNDTDQCVNDNLYTFTNTSTINKGTLTYNWDFGNDSTNTTTNPILTYNKDTTYPVRLLATSDFNCVDSITKFMLVFPKPQASFGVNDTDQCINTNSFDFTNNTTIKYGTLTYNWDFGDGALSTDENPNYVYPVQGTYPVTLIAKSNNDCFDTTMGISILYPKPNPDFAINDTDQCLKTQNFIFTNNSTIDSGTYTNRWQFSDGVVYIDSVNVTRTFNAPISHTVSLVLTSNQNCKDSLSKGIIVYPHPNPDFTGLKLVYCSDDPLLPLTPIVPGGTFEGKNMQNDTFVPLISGDDTVKYTVQVNGCFSDTSKFTRVFGLPNLGIGPDTTLCRQEFLKFDISFPNSTYLWSTGSTSPFIRITEPGTYTANLFNICDTLTSTVVVSYRDYDCNFFFPNAFTPNGDGLNDIFLPFFEDDVIGMELNIFNRWGEIIFTSNDLTKGWDGTYKGEAVQDGVYMWTANLVINESGDNLYRHSAGGQVHLIR